MVVLQFMDKNTQHKNTTLYWPFQTKKWRSKNFWAKPALDLVFLLDVTKCIVKKRVLTDVLCVSSSSGDHHCGGHWHIFLAMYKNKLQFSATGSMENSGLGCKLLSFCSKHWRPMTIVPYSFELLKTEMKELQALWFFPPCPIRTINFFMYRCFLIVINYIVRIYQWGLMSSPDWH